MTPFLFIAHVLTASCVRFPTIVRFLTDVCPSKWTLIVEEYRTVASFRQHVGVPFGRLSTVFFLTMCSAGSRRSYSYERNKIRRHSGADNGLN